MVKHMMKNITKDTPHGMTKDMTCGMAKNMRPNGGAVKFLSILLIFLLTTTVLIGSVAAEDVETTDISPIVSISYKSIPDLTVEQTVKVEVVTTLDNSTKDALKELKENVTGVAYLVNLSSTGINVSDVTNVTINLPVPKTWAESQKNICVLKQSDGFAQIVNTELLENETTDSILTYKAQIQSTNDCLAVVGVETLSPVVETETPTPASNQTQTQVNETANTTETTQATTPADTPVGLVGVMLGGFGAFGVYVISRRVK